MTWTAPGDLVVDPFVGAGTTTKMAAINGRRWFGIDMSQEYVEIATKRMEVAEQMVQDGYERDYTPEEEDPATSGKMTHKEISSMKKKDMVETMLAWQEELAKFRKEKK